tara:strand:- start:374 stop:538 length:165 start_codon:yes stop_codon:yes gene_type:complete
VFYAIKNGVMYAQWNGINILAHVLFVAIQRFCTRLMIKRRKRRRKRRKMYLIER